jgi:hypothetical protein
MADQTVVKQTVPNNGKIEVAAAAYKDLTAANNGIFLVPRDGKFLLHVIDAAGGAIITVKAGVDTILENQGDYVSAALTINLHNFFVLESARFKAMSGADKGYVRVTTSANVKAALIEIP